VLGQNSPSTHFIRGTPLDIASIVNYDQVFELELLHPVDDTPTGIIFWIRSSGSEASKSVARKHLDKNIERRAKGKLVQGMSLEKETIETAASYIERWDWGKDPKTGEPNKFKGELLGTNFSMKKAMEVLEVDWIYTQVTGAANKIENFTPSSSKSSPPTSASS
jgi:hypothetical protein